MATDMPYFLLTGAGFSRNWGGILSPEMFNQLIGSSLIDDELRRLLWRERSFEDVLAALQLASDPASKRRHDLLVSELVGIFNAMGNAYMQREFEFRQPPDTRYSVASFLARFDAIFTLNQDTLIEQKYLPLVSGRWARAGIPGMKHPSAFVPTGAVQDRFAVMESNPSEFRLSPGIQPYIKLHGSCNWNQDGIGRILILGGQKAVSIGQFPVLTYYHQEFRKHLELPGARLMVIGYSFSDTHINGAILDATRHKDLRIYLVDPQGDRILDKRDPRAQIPDRPGELMLDIPPRVIGMSTRPLETTFDRDTVEHANLMRFFEL